MAESAGVVSRPAGDGRNRRNAHLLGLSHADAGLQAEETRPLRLPRFLDGRPAQSRLRRGVAAKSPHGARYLSAGASGARRWGEWILVRRPRPSGRLAGANEAAAGGADAR